MFVNPDKALELYVKVLELRVQSAKTDGSLLEVNADLRRLSESLREALNGVKTKE